MSIFTHSKSKFSTDLVLARKAAGLTGEQVASHLGKSSHSVVANWENDKALPMLDDFVELCKLYKITPNELLGF
ncbi:MAG: helix-turn-helix transcriptional regulator [Cellvibrio sp.]